MGTLHTQCTWSVTTGVNGSPIGLVLHLVRALNVLFLIFLCKSLSVEPCPRRHYLMVKPDLNKVNYFHTKTELPYSCLLITYQMGLPKASSNV
jgi:hypothetical protein